MSMQPADHSSQDLRLSWRRWGALLSVIAQNRVALALVELNEEKWRLIRALVLLGILFTSGCFALALITIAIVAYYWADYGLLLLIGFAFTYAAAAVAAWLSLRRHIRNWPPPLSDTLAEIRKDCECLHPPK